MTATDDDIKALEEALAKATPGPWSWGHAIADYDPKTWTLQPGILIADGTDGTPGGDKRDRTNAALIVAAVNIAPALIARLRAAEAERDGLAVAIGKAGIESGITRSVPLTGAQLLLVCDDLVSNSRALTARAEEAEAERDEAREALRRIADGPWPDTCDSPEEQCRFDEQVAREALSRIQKEAQDEG